MDDERLMLVALQFVVDLQYWVQRDPRITLKILRLVVEIFRDPLGGMGKPEPLKHNLGGFWSRRISGEDRLIYRVRDDWIEFVRARAHYG